MSAVGAGVTNDRELLALLENVQAVVQQHLRTKKRIVTDKRPKNLPPAGSEKMKPSQPWTLPEEWQPTWSTLTCIDRTYFQNRSESVPLS